jgi:murein L,D-transpeptidase YafK
MYKLVCLLLVSALLMHHSPDNLPDSDRAKAIRQKIWPKVQADLADKNLNPGQPVYIRIFKEEDDLEIWVKSGAGFKFFKSYNICFFSGGLGTKTKTGDGRSPEGFYSIQPSQLNPLSNYHLAIDVGYPNRLETSKGYTGDNIKIHGHCASIGCYAMTDDGIDEIYTIVYKAFEAGQRKIQLDIFPFRMDAEHMKKYNKASCLAFWQSMKPGYDLFEKNHVPTVAKIIGKDYAF